VTISFSNNILHPGVSIGRLKRAETIIYTRVTVTVSFIPKLRLQGAENQKKQTSEYMK
jgi:hypothetical protein